MPEDASGDGTDDRDGRDAGTGPPRGTGSDGDAESEPVADWGDVESDLKPQHRTAGDDRADSDRIPLDLSGRESDVESSDDDPEEYAPEPSSAPIEAGTPKLEHAIFVLLGAIAMLLVVARLLALPLG